MAIPFLASYISGVTLQTDDVTSAVPRSYVDGISGALDARIDALAGATEVTFSPLTAGVGIEALEGVTAISGGTAVSLDVQGYSTISSQAKYGYDYATVSGDRISQFVASGDEYSAAYLSGQRVMDLFNHELFVTSANVIANYVASATARENFAWSSAVAPVRIWYDASSNQFGNFLASGEKYSGWYGSGATFGAINDWWVASGHAYSEIEASGGKYTQAYASAQLLKDGAFIKVTSGWFYASDTSTIPHGLGANPNHVTLTPSGTITYSTAFTCDATNIYVRVSHASQRMLNWRAEL